MKNSFIVFVLVFSFIGNHYLASQDRTSGIRATGFQQIKERNFFCGTPEMTPEYIKKTAENTKKTDKDFFLKTAQHMKKISKVTYQIGDTMQFYAVDHTKNEFYTLTAELKAIGQRTQVWVEKAELENGRVTSEIINSIIERLEHSTPQSSKNPDKGIVDLETEYFGSPPNKDGDGLVDFLLLDIKDNYPNISTYYAGYFTPNDQAPGDGSNMRDMLYIDTYPSLSDINNLFNNLAHEYQHLIHYNYDKNEVTFLNEGCSQYAQILTGFNFDNPTPFLINTNRALTQFVNASDPGIFADYTKVQLWVLYLAEQLGDAFIKSLIQNPENGIQSIKSLLSSVTPQISWETLFGNWIIANILNNTQINPEWGYVLPEAKLFKASPHHHHNEFPVAVNNERINAVAGKYSSFSDGITLDMAFDFNFVKAKAIEFAQNETRVVTIDPSTGFSEDKFGSTYNKITVCFYNPVELDEDYSYTANAEQSYFVRELSYDDGVNDILYTTESGAFVNILWFGYHTPGSGWAVKFHPPNQNSQLLKFKFYGGVFDKGSFEIRIYDDSGKNNSPGRILAPPKQITIEPSAYFKWIEVDFTDQSGFLTGFENDFYISIQHSIGDTSAVILAIDKLSNPDSKSWALFGSTFDEPGWIPFVDLKVTTDRDETISLENFTLMFRAEMTFADEEEPVLNAGFLQHPVFSENLDIYAFGEKELAMANLTGEITFGDTIETLEFQESGSSGKIFVDNDVVITQNGKVDIYVEGTNKYGFIKKDTTISFNVQGIQTNTEGKISTLDKRVSLTIPPFALERNSKIIAANGIPFQPGKKLIKVSELSDTGLGKPVTFSPFINLSANAVLSFKIDKKSEKEFNGKNLYIAHLKDGRWFPLSSYFDEEMKTISAFITSLGTYQLRYNRENEITVPLEYNLYQNYPNPFNPSTTIKFSLKRNEFVSLKIYNILGQEIKTLLRSYKEKGIHTVVWDGTDSKGKPVASGLYFYRLRTGNFSKTLKLIITR